MEPDPCPLHKREKLRRYRTDKALLCLFREVFHPEKQGLPCQGRRAWNKGLLLGWQQDNEQSWDHPSRGNEPVWGPAMRSISMSRILLMLNQSKNKYNGVGWAVTLCNLQLSKPNHPRGYSKATPEAVWQNPSISEMLIRAELADQGNNTVDEDRRPAADYRFK